MLFPHIKLHSISRDLMVLIREFLHFNLSERIWLATTFHSMVSPPPNEAVLSFGVRQSSRNEVDGRCAGSDLVMVIVFLPGLVRIYPSISKLFQDEAVKGLLVSKGIQNTKTKLANKKILSDKFSCFDKLLRALN